MERVRVAAQLGELHVLALADGLADGMRVDLAGRELLQAAAQAGGPGGLGPLKLHREARPSRARRRRQRWLRRARDRPRGNQRLALEGAQDPFRLVLELGAHVHHAAVTGGGGGDAEHGRARPYRVADVAGLWEADVEVGEVGDRLLGDVVHREGEGEIHAQHGCKRAVAEAGGARPQPRSVNGRRVLEAGGEQGDHAVVDRDLPGMEIARAHLELGEQPPVAPLDALCFPAAHCFPKRRLAMISYWISLVPSKMRKTRASRQKRCAGYSRE